LDIALGVAFAESGGYTDAVGDLGLISEKWAPSIGLFQIRSLRDPDAWGPLDHVRRASELRDPLYNAQAAWVISQGGTDWTPWSVFKSGTYLPHVGVDFPLLTGHPRADLWDA
jgi:hypothetical protein